MIHHLDVIIPVRNESANVVELTERLRCVLTELGVRHKLIFIDDHSTDDTLIKLQGLSINNPIKVKLKQGRMGKAYSIFEGAALADSEYVAIIDGDLQYPPEALKPMLQLIPENGVVVANRKIHHTSPLRYFATRLSRFVTNRLLLGLNCDTQSGLKIFRKDILRYLNPDNIGAWSLDAPLLMKALSLDMSVGEVDIEFSESKNGNSKIKPFLATWQIISGSIRTRLFSPTTLSVPGMSSCSAIGAGVVHHRRRYVTHNGLSPQDSAVRTFHFWQKIIFMLISFLIILGLVYATLSTVIFAVGVLTAIYAFDALFNFIIVFKSLNQPPEVRYTPTELASLDKKLLPVYTILCPLYREAAVLPDFVKAISEIDWPENRLDVILLLEEDDKETLTAAVNLGLPSYFRTVVVPDSSPKTKPKACNYGLHFAKGEYIVVYDAEDRPDPQQLKKAYLGFRKSPENIVCLQGKLNYYNPNRNLLTRLFTAEYSLWFDIVLPGLQSINTAIPLGGTSNHFKTEILRHLQGWDAFNVTEDCDLGTRLFKKGYKTALIDSVTLEEANSNLSGWIRQRSRWIKGYVQTFLVHNRHPLDFIRNHGVHALIFQLIIGLRITFMVINPFLWLATLSYFVLYQYVGPAIESIYPTPVFYLAVFSAVFGNFMFFYDYMIGCARRERWDLIKYVFLIPVYWLMISIAAVKAAYQLVVKPHYWEKTNHGLVPQPVVPRIRLSFNFSLEAALLVTSSVAVNLVNFLYNAFLSYNQKITLAEFGTISLIGSFFGLFQIPANALSRTVAYRSGFLSGKYSAVPKQFWSYIRKRAFKLSLIATAVWLIFTPWLPGIFGSGSVIPFLLFAPVWIIGTLAAVDGGFLTGNTKFSLMAFAAVIETVSKYLLTLLILDLGRIPFIYAAIPLASFISFIFTWIAARKMKPTAPLPDGAVISHFPLRFFTTSLAVRISTLSFLSMDIILAKMFLNPDQAGRYALISLIGKIVYFAGSVFSQFILPIVSQAEGAGRNSRTVFLRLLFVTTAVSLVTAVIFGFFGRITAPYLFGSKIVPIVGLLPWFTLAMVAFTVATNIVNYYQIRHEYTYTYISLLMIPFQVLLLYSARGDLTAFVSAMFYSGFGYLILIGLLQLYYHQLKIIIRNLIDFIGVFLPLPNGQKYSSSKLRILIFNWRDTPHIWAGGAEVYIHEMAKRWVENGHKVTVFCGNDGKSPRNEIIDGVKVVRRGGFFTVYLWAPVYYLMRFAGHFDVIVDCENGIPFFTPLFSRLPVFLLIHHIHQNVFREHLGYFQSRLACYLESRVMPAVYKNRRVITVSDSSKADIINLSIAPAENVSVVNPGIDPVKFRIKDKTPYPSFLYLGRLRSYKNIDTAIMAFFEVLNMYPQTRLTIAGWGENITELKNLVNKLRITASVSFEEHVTEDRKVELLGSAWAMIQPSSFEGWGITVLEANACGTPVIASDVGGLRDSVVNTITGLLVPVKNPSKMAEAMENIIIGENLRNQLSIAAFRWSQSFAWDVKAGEFLQILNSHLMEQTTATVIRKLIYAASD